MRAKLVVVYGTRPEAVKLAPVASNARSSGLFDVTVVCTGQHQELLQNADAAFGGLSDVELSLMRDGQTPMDFVARAVGKLDSLLASLSPDMLLAQGDTSTAFAATLAAFHRGIPTGHVEAGLRTHDLSAPFPEEAYRQMIDRIATRLYAPSEVSAQNLRDEGRKDSDILVTGNTGIDAVVAIASSKRGRSWGKSPFVLATLHRRESFGEPLRRICRALARIAREGSLSVVLPVHPNPAVRSVVHELLDAVPGVILCDPIPYPEHDQDDARRRMRRHRLGGIQEEAPTLGVPVLVTRETTERPEAVLAGSALLVGSDEDRIVAEVLRLRRDARARAEMATPRNVYGDGKASVRILLDVGETIRRALGGAAA